MTFKEYRKSILSKNRHKNIYSQYRMKYLSRQVKKRLKSKLDDLLIAKIIGDLNKECTNYLLKYGEITFPANIGKIEIRKVKTKVWLEDGKVRTTKPIDWCKTLKLWYEDAEAAQKKILLRRPDEYKYYIMYNRISSNYKYSQFYIFDVIKETNRRLSILICNNEFDTFEHEQRI